MAQYVINIGALPNDGTGDPLRTAFNETNLNFNQVFAAGPVLSNIRIANNTILTTNTNGNLVLNPNGIGAVVANAHVLPDQTNIRNLGSASRQWDTVYSRYINVGSSLTVAGDATINGNLTIIGNTIQIGNIVTDTKTIQLSNTAVTDSAANGSGITVGANDDIATFLYDSGNNVWTTNIGVQVSGAITGTSIAVSDATVYGNLDAINGNFTGNVSASYLFGNGSQLSGITATTISNTAPAIGNGSIWWNTVDGRAYVKYNGQFIDLSPSLVPDPTTYVGNVSFDNIEITNVGNIIPAGNNAYSLGSAAFQWKDLWVSNNTIYINSVPITLGAGNVLTVNGNAVLQNNSNSSISTTGNITADYFFGNGSQLTGLSANSIFNGNSNVAIATADGNVTVTTAGTNTWTFATAGQTIPPALNVARGDNPSGNISGYTLNLGDGSQEAIITTPDGDADGDPNSQRIVINPGKGADTTSGEGGDIYLWAGRGGDQGGTGGDVKIRGGQGMVDGSGGYIRIEGGDSQGAGAGGYIDLIGGTSTTSTGGPIQIQSGQGVAGANIDLTGGTGTAGPGGSININGGVSANGLAEYGNVAVTAGASTWTFDNGGNLTLPDSTSFQNFGPGSAEWHAGANGYVSLASNNGNTYMWVDNNGAYIGTNWIPGSYVWTFANTGSMTAPGAINVGDMSIGTVPGDITANANTGITVNVSGPDGGFAVNYLDEVGNANTSGGELAFSSETGNATYRISLSDDLGDGFATKIWRFDGTGNFNLPSGGNIVGVTAYNSGRIQWVGNSSGDGAGYTTLGLIPDDTLVGNDQYLIIDPTAPGHIHIRAGGQQDNSNADLFLGGEYTHFKVTAGANNQARIMANSWPWTFGADGTFTLPANADLNGSQINSVANSSGDGAGYTTLQLVPDVTIGTGTDQYVIIDPTAPGHIHIRAGGTQDDSSADLILGGENSHVKVTAGLDPPVYIRANNQSWTFTTDGVFQTPGNISANGNVTANYFIGDGSQLTGLPASYGNANVATFLASYGSNTISTSGNVAAGNFIGAGANVDIVAGSYDWTFVNDGNLLLPGNTFAVKYANGTAVSLGGNYGDANVTTLLGNLGSNNISTTGNVTAGNLIGNIQLTGNIQGTSANVELVAGTYTFTFDNTGVATFPTIGGDEGGEIHLGIPAANTTLQNSVKIDVYQDRLRFFEGSANAKGAYVDIANCPNGVSTAIGYREIPQIAFSANATAAANAAGCHYYSTTAGNLALTLPDNSSVAFPTGATLTVVVNAAGNVLVNQGTGVTLYQAGASATGNRVVGAYGLATVMKVAANTWVISGTGVY